MVYVINETWVYPTAFTVLAISLGSVGLSGAAVFRISADSHIETLRVLRYP